MPMRTACFLLLSLFSIECAAQEPVIGHLAQPETLEDGSMEQLYEDIEEQTEAPLDLNTATRSQLEAIPFLTPQQVMDIIEYRDRVKRIETTNELLLIPSLERPTIELLKQIVIISPQEQRQAFPLMRDILRYGKSTLLADIKVPFYHRQGEDSWLGPSCKHWLRYTFRYGQQVSLGLAAAQDAGEPFFKGKNKYGYDFYTGYLLLKNIGRLQNLVLGRYRLRFGLGLILNNSFGLGKLATMTTLMNASTRISGHNSRTEGNYLQGAAGTVSLSKKLDLTAFVSYRKIDATLNKDSTTVATILTSGYHRTASEMNRRRNTSVALVGGHLNWFSNGFHVGFTGYYTSFNRKLKMDKGQLYRQWYPHGSDFYNLSIDYGYLSRKLTISGETATDKNAQVATINLISYALTPSLTLLALQRYYPYKYQAIYANSLAEGGSVNDESAVLLGGKWRTWNDAVFSFYSDLSYFAWPKYATNGSTHRWDNVIQLDCDRDSWTLLLRYRMKMKELKSQTAPSTIKKFDHRARLAVAYTTPTFRLTTQADAAYVSKETASHGYMFSETARWQHRWLKLIASAAYFNTTSYDARVYSYEPGLLYTLSFPAFYGEGIRSTLNARADLCSNLTLICSCGYTHSFHRPLTSEVPDESARGNTRSDLELQLRWRF